MPGYISDGKPLQEPDEAYAQNISNIAPSWEESLGALWEQGPTASWMRADERGANWGSSVLDSTLWRIGKMPWEMPDVSTELTPDEANAKYAPPGTKITDKPVGEDLARVLGEQKQQQIQRNSVLARYSENTGWPAQLGMGLAATLLDPINLATTFIPGIGEESILARLGSESFGAKLLARGVSGFSAGALSQAPVTALKYGFSQEEHDDYSLMSAFADMATAGGMNAAFHGVGGALGDLFKRPRTVDASLEAPLQTRQAAMSSAVAQLVDGREVDTTPVFGEPRAPTPAPIPDHLQAELTDIQAELGKPGLTPEAEDALWTRQYQITQEAKALAETEAPGIAAAASTSIPDLAAEQAELYKNGFAQGIPQTEFDQAAADIYKTPGQRAKEAADYARGETTPASTLAQTPTQARLSDLEAQWAGVEEHANLSQAERDELDVSARGVATAESRADALEQAASCLKEAGI